ncbi:probable inactive peptidyl-prolyl cis-trans isomerase-like 6 isoform X2 [Amphibalanus amphitrite]|uniref:probable inactive peptidyl-prolyl cis-trans isomerase-like 6 isoform X2 n=1 Tax=Amphibalanus amphitrite TaxID=1232801 RepID=UPI001C90A474|nr:probable inactive peptidyl-prolyl cis-trans isomerase-like 6 isoform X2 [Amphibalanus amphitrite]
MAAAELPPLEAVWVSPSMGAAPPARFVPVHLQVYGVAGSAQLAALAGCAQHLHRRRPNLFLRAPHVLPMYEAEWSAFVDNLRKLVTGGEAWCLSGPAVLFCDSQYVGDLDRAVDWITETFGIPIDLEEIETPGDIYRQTMLARKNSVVFLDVSYDGRAVGRLVFELFDELLPRASRNFRQLCSGRGGVSARSGTVLWYAGTPVHRIVRGGWLQAGGGYRWDSGRRHRGRLRRARRERVWRPVRRRVFRRGSRPARPALDGRGRAQRQHLPVHGGLRADDVHAEPVLRVRPADRRLCRSRLPGDGGDQQRAAHAHGGLHERRRAARAERRRPAGLVRPV